MYQELRAFCILISKRKHRNLLKHLKKSKKNRSLITNSVSELALVDSNIRPNHANCKTLNCKRLALLTYFHALPAQKHQLSLR